MTTRPDYYKILQVDAEAEAEIIAVAYKRLAAKYHPDVNPAPDADRRMRELNAAYEVLGDAGRRADYDVQRRRGAPRGRRATGAAAKSAAAVLVVSPRSLAFGRVRKGANPTARLEIGVTEGRTLIGEVRATHPWIHLSVNRLFSDLTAVQVSVDIGDLEEGRHYTGGVVVDSIVFGTRTVPVSLSVAASVRPVLRVTPTLLDFGATRFGQPPKVIELRIANAGAGQLNGILKPRQDWLNVTQSAFTANTVTLEAMACGDGLLSGRTHTGEIEIVSNGGKAVITARLDVMAEGLDGATPVRVFTRDLAYLQERLDILSHQPGLSSVQKQERNIIGYLLRTCRGGDVADMLQRGIASAQGAEGIGWRDGDGVLQGTAQAVDVLTGLLERLRKWEEAER